MRCTVKTAFPLLLSKERNGENAIWKVKEIGKRLLRNPLRRVARAQWAGRLMDLHGKGVVLTQPICRQHCVQLCTNTNASANTNANDKKGNTNTDTNANADPGFNFVSVGSVLLTQKAGISNTPWCSNLELVLVKPHGGQLCDLCQSCPLLAKFGTTYVCRLMLFTPSSGKISV